MPTPDELCLLAADLFVIPYQKRYVLYAPLRKAVALVNQETLGLLNLYLKSGEDSIFQNAQEVYEQLSKCGLFNSVPPAPLYPDEYHFVPHEVTLFPTSNCNLRCVYCYASAGRKNIRMDWPVAKAAVDFIFNNALQAGVKGCIVGFHGGGEPSLEWDLIQRTTEYAKNLAAQNKLELRVHMATNGILSNAKRDYIIKHFSSVNVSLDGPPEIHDLQRPMANGKGSFHYILESLKYFDDHAFSYGIRPTITSKSVSMMPDLVDFFAENFELTYLHFEPLFFCGRCITTQWDAPKSEEFVKFFRHAMKRARKLKIRIYYSGARLDVVTSKFCAAAGDGFSITPSGAVTSCFEVCDEDDPRSAIFHYGYFDPITQKFVFNQEKLQALRKLHVENFAFCQNCFCKWHCAGDCLSKVLSIEETVNHNGSERCQMNRSLTLLQIIDLLKNSK